MSTLKNSGTPDQIDDRNDDAILSKVHQASQALTTCLVKSSIRSESEPERQDEILEPKQEDENEEYQDEIEDEGEEQKRDDSLEDICSNKDEFLLDKNLDLPTTEKVAGSKAITSSRKTKENTKSSSSPLIEESKSNDISDNNFEPGKYL